MNTNKQDKDINQDKEVSQDNSGGPVRFQAKVASHGFRGQYWQEGDIVEVTPEEAEIIPEHFEKLGKATDGSDEPEMIEKLVEQEKIDNLKDKKAKKSYDRVQPRLAHGPATLVEKTPEQRTQEDKDRKAEEVENKKRIDEDRKNPRRKSVEVSGDDSLEVVENPKGKK